jgi:hypothetical protein
METAAKAARLDKRAVSIQSLHEPADDRDYWLAQPSAARLAAVELQRQLIYGYDPAATRLQRVFEVVEHPRG